MSMKDLQDAIMAQASRLDEQSNKLQAQAEAHMHLVQRADNIVEGFKQELMTRDKLIEAINQQLSDKQALIDTLCDVQADMKCRLEKLETLVMARNASAATKRNMTDDDARRVLTGDLKDKPHKEAAEIAGLTYAQVYSCRGEFTFKHIHKDLREHGVDGKKWESSWGKK